MLRACVWIRTMISAKWSAQRTPFLLVVGLLVSAAAVSVNRAATIAGTAADWPVYRGDPKGTQYAPLAQIHAANVHRLRPAWVYRTGDAAGRSTMHANPIV